MSGEDVLTRAEVAALFRVHPSTVARWARSGRLAFIRTPGGQRRYRRRDVERFLTNVPAGNPAAPAAGTDRRTASANHDQGAPVK